MQRPVVNLVFLALALALAACGGGTATAAPDGGGGSAPPAATDAAAPTNAADAPTDPASAPTDAPKGPGSAGGVCDLATVDELAGVFGTPVSTRVLAGPPDTCLAETAEGDVLVSWVLATENAASVYELLTDGARPVPGIGDKAAFVENTGLLVLKGSSLLTVAISGMADLSEEAGEAAAKEVAALIAARM